MTEQYFYNSGFNQHLQGYNDQAELARQLQRLKANNSAKEREEKKLIEENEQIKRVKILIETGYQNMERSKQIAQKQVRRINQLRNQAQLETDILKKRDFQERIERQKQLDRKKRMVEGKHIIEQQMLQKYDRKKQAQEQYLKEKQQVDKVLQKLRQDQFNQLKQEAAKKLTAQSDMKEALDLKSQQKQIQKNLIKKENEKYLAYIKEMDARETAIKQKKAEEEAVKNAIFQKLKAEEQKRRRDQEELQRLRMQLYQEEYQADAIRKERQQSLKKERQKRQMQEAEHMARQNKKRQLEQQKRMQEQFRVKMMQKFAKDDKLEQLAQQKRRMKQLQHRKEVERLWQERLNAYRQQKAVEEKEIKLVKEDQSWKDQIIRRQKQRLLRQHMPNLQGYAPKELQKTFMAMQGSKGSGWTNYAEAFRLK